MGTNPITGSGAKPWLTGGGTHPSLGSAVTQTLSSPRSESVHQAENLVLGPVCSQQSRGPAREKTAGVAARRGWSSQLMAGLVLSTQGAAEVPASHNLPLPQVDFFLYLGNCYFTCI